MKVLKRSESLLVIGERGLDTRHWGIFMFILAGGGYTALYLDGDVLPLGMHIGMIGAAVLGLLVAIFTGKRLTHRLDKTTGYLRVEHPVRINTKLQIEDYRLSDISAVKATKQDLMSQALLNSSDLPGGRLPSSSGFSYVLKDGKEVESGIFTSETEKIDLVIQAVSEFLQVPVQ